MGDVKKHLKFKKLEINVFINSHTPTAMHFNTNPTFS